MLIKTEEYLVNGDKWCCSHTASTAAQPSLCCTLSHYGRYQGGINNVTYLRSKQTLLSLSPTKPTWFVTNEWATALSWLFVNRVWFAWHFASENSNQAREKCTESANSSTDLDQSKQTIGVKTPSVLSEFSSRKLLSVTVPLCCRS